MPLIMSDELQDRLKLFVDEAQKLIVWTWNNKGRNGPCPKLIITYLYRWIRLDLDLVTDFKPWAFINPVNGNIHRSNGWTRGAMMPVGSILDDDLALPMVTADGPRKLRG